MRANTPFTFRPHPADPGEWPAWAAELPFVRAVELHPTIVVPGRAFAVLERSVWPLNPNGAVNGGLIAAVADQVMGIAAMTVVEPGLMTATATLDSHYLRPARLPLTFDAHVTRSGRSITFVQLDVTGADGRSCLAALGTWSCNRAAPAD